MGVDRHVQCRKVHKMPDDLRLRKFGQGGGDLRDRSYRQQFLDRLLGNVASGKPGRSAARSGKLTQKLRVASISHLKPI